MKQVRTAYDFTNECYVHFGHDIEFDGFRYHVIFGHHSHGGYICIPDRHIVCEASDYPNSTYYNTDRLMGAGLTEDVAKTIAAYIESQIKKGQ